MANVFELLAPLIIIGGMITGLLTFQSDVILNYGNSDNIDTEPLYQIAVQANQTNSNIVQPLLNALENTKSQTLLDTIWISGTAAFNGLLSILSSVSIFSGIFGILFQYGIIIPGWFITVLLGIVVLVIVLLILGIVLRSKESMI